MSDAGLYLETATKVDEEPGWEAALFIRELISLSDFSNSAFRSIDGCWGNELDILLRYGWLKCTLAEIDEDFKMENKVLFMQGRSHDKPATLQNFRKFLPLVFCQFKNSEKETIWYSSLS